MPLHFFYITCSGHGEEALETEKDFSRYGRVNYVLQKRLDLLKEVVIFLASIFISFKKH